MLKEICENDPSLKRAPYTDYAAISVNLKKSQGTFPHLDDKNSQQDMCGVTPTGTFDSTKGGHMILWELRLVIQFPAYSTIFLPSSLITHGNTPIAAGEERASFVFYTAGGLHMFRDLGMSTLANLKKRYPQKAKQFLKDGPERVKEGLKYFMHVTNFFPNADI